MGDTHEIRDIRMQQRLPAHQADSAEETAHSLDFREHPKIAPVFIERQEMRLSKWREVAAANAVEVAMAYDIHIERGLSVHVRKMQQERAARIHPAFMPLAFPVHIR